MAQLPASVVTNGASGLNLSGTLAGSFTDNGAGLTNVPGVLVPQTPAGTNVAAQTSTVYNATNAAPVTFTLPATANVGDVIQVNGLGAGGWNATSLGNIGVFWTSQGGAPAANWSAVASSADGNKLVAVVYGGQIYTSAATVSGPQGSSQQFQYAGNGVWQPVNPANVALRAGGNNFTGNQTVMSGNVGIGTTTPNAPLSFGSSLGNTKLALWDGGAGSAIGFGVQGNQFRLHVNNSSDRFAFFNAPAGTEVMTILVNGNVGIGKSDPGYTLEVNGSAHRVDNSASWTTTSDRRLKQDIATIGNGLELVRQIRPVDFRYTEAYCAANPGLPAAEQYGVIAQEFQQVFPDFVETNSTGYLMVNPTPLTFVNTAAIKELNQKLEEQKAENAELKKSVAELKRLVEKLAKQK